jgi:hypothetical protein
MTLRNPALPAFLGLACLATAAQAHLSYSGRNLGAFTGTEDASATIANQAITGNFGWADAADANLGDSHKARAFRFSLASDSWVSITAAANPTATASSIAGLLPGFSLYSGLAAISPFSGTQTSADHDGADASLAWRTAWAQANLGVSFDYSATDGSWNAKGDWKIGGDGDVPGNDAELSRFVLQGFSFDADLDGTATGTFQLQAGDYTILVGGNDLANKLSADAGKAYGLSLTLAVGPSLTPVPEPASAALVALGAGALLLKARRRR